MTKPIKAPFENDVWYAVKMFVVITKINMTLREAIIAGLGDSWTKELEDSLFWSISGFVDVVSENVRKEENNKWRAIFNLPLIL